MPTEKKTYLCRVVNDLEVEKYLWRTEIQDNENNILESLTYDDSGEVIQYEKREFLNGKLNRLKEIDYENQIETVKTYRYQNEFIIQERVQFENGSYFDTNYVYDNSNKILSITKIDESSTVLGKEITTYDKTSQLVQFVDEIEYIFRQEETEFGKENRPIKKVSEEFFINEKDEEEVIKSIETYEYDAVGNEVKMVIERYDKIIFQKESIYNSLNLNTEIKIWSIETDFISKYNYKYDHKGNMIKETLLEKDKLMSEFNFSYNHRNQLVKIDKTYLEVDDYYITYREIIERGITSPRDK